MLLILHNKCQVIIFILSLHSFIFYFNIMKCANTTSSCRRFTPRRLISLIVNTIDGQYNILPQYYPYSIWSLAVYSMLHTLLSDIGCCSSFSKNNNNQWKEALKICIQFALLIPCNALCHFQNPWLVFANDYNIIPSIGSIWSLWLLHYYHHHYDWTLFVHNHRPCTFSFIDGFQSTSLTFHSTAILYAHAHTHTRDSDAQMHRVWWY